MFKLSTIGNYIVVKNKEELRQAKKVDICNFVVWEHKATITIWKRRLSTWTRFDYNIFNENEVEDLETTGFEAYVKFYNYCGREEVEKMKNIFPNIDIWDSEEQLHFCNFDFAGQKIYKKVYVYDANSAFTYGVLGLPSGFNKLKDYILTLYDKKKNATTKYLRQKYKNLQNFLIGYFARIKDFISLRSEIIRKSNLNIIDKMTKIKNAGGIVYISNTDSIITDEIGHKVMQEYVGEDVGMFKLEKIANRLYYNSSNSYQIGDKLVWSGLGYFARRYTDVFKEQYAKQYGSLIEQFDFCISENNGYKKLCKLRYGEIVVVVKNNFDEVIKTYLYKIGEN